MLLAVAFGVLVAAAALAASALRLTSPLTFLLAVYVFSWTGLVALTELLSLGHGVGTLGYGIGEVVLLVAAAAWWQLVGRPRPPFSVRASGPILSGHPLVLGLAVVVCAVVAYALIVGVSTTPNNPDGMIYHLSRAAAWLQQGGLQYIPGAHTERENELPQNGEIGILYTFSFLKRDTAATLPQLAAFIALIDGVAADDAEERSRPGVVHRRVSLPLDLAGACRGCARRPRCGTGRWNEVDCVLRASI